MFRNQVQKPNSSSSIKASAANEDSHKQRKMRAGCKKPAICIEANNTLVKKAADQLGLVEVGKTSPWNILWTDVALTVQQCLAVERFQMVNFFPGINEITRKDLLARNLSRMQKLFPDEYDFFPKTWWLPADFKELQQFSKQQEGCFYIVKPGSSSQGRGIFITKNLGEVEGLQQFVCQQYIPQPLLIDGFKFDMRVYALITSCDPLRIFVFNEGIARFATQKYMPPSAENMHNVFMHLTNYSINKHSREFLSGEKGSKRRISTINSWLASQGYDTALIWKMIDDVIIKTVITAAENLKRQYQMSFPRHPQGCFILLGFDVLLDSDLKPRIIEVNRCPSLNIDSPIDQEIKEKLLVDIFTLLNLGRLDQHRVKGEERKRVFESNQLAIKKIAIKSGSAQEEIAEGPKTETPLDAVEIYKKQQIEWEEKHLGNFRLVYPSTNHKDYDKYLAEATISSLFQETAASKARKEAVLKSLQQVEAEIVPAFEDYTLQEDEVRVCGNIVSRGRITSINSFEPSFISLAEEREREKEMEKREMLIRKANLRAAIVDAMRINGLLRPNDVEQPKLERVKYSILPKINPDFMPFEAEHNLHMF